MLTIINQLYNYTNQISTTLINVNYSNVVKSNYITILYIYQPLI